jgi:hypothetical protein
LTVNFVSFYLKAVAARMLESALLMNTNLYRRLYLLSIHIHCCTSSYIEEPGADTKRTLDLAGLLLLKETGYRFFTVFNTEIFRSSSSIVNKNDPKLITLFHHK